MAPALDRGSDSMFAIAIFFAVEWIVDYFWDKIRDGVLDQ
jgi:hypothetical protein